MQARAPALLGSYIAMLSVRLLTFLVVIFRVVILGMGFGDIFWFPCLAVSRDFATICYLGLVGCWAWFSISGILNREYLFGLMLVVSCERLQKEKNIAQMSYHFINTRIKACLMVDNFFASFSFLRLRRSEVGAGRGVHWLDVQKRGPILSRAFTGRVNWFWWECWRWCRGGGYSTSSTIWTRPCAPRICPNLKILYLPESISWPQVYEFTI